MTGRFTTRDTVIGDYESPQTLNRYVYCVNNPHKYTDPDGKFAELAAATITGGLFGAFSRSIMYGAHGIITGEEMIAQGMKIAAATGFVGGATTVLSGAAHLAVPGSGAFVAGVGAGAEYAVEQWIKGESIDAIEGSLTMLSGTFTAGIMQNVVITQTGGAKLNIGELLNPVSTKWADDIFDVVVIDPIISTARDGLIEMGNRMLNDARIPQNDYYNPMEEQRR